MGVDGRVAVRALDGRMRGRCLGEATPQETLMFGKISCCLGRLAVVIAGVVALGGTTASAQVFPTGACCF